MADPYQDMAGPAENYGRVITHQAGLQTPESSNNASAFHVTDPAATAPVLPWSESTPEDYQHMPEDIFGSGGEDWQGYDSDWLMQPDPDAFGLLNLGESIHTQASVREQASQAIIDPFIVSHPAIKWYCLSNISVGNSYKRRRCQSPAVGKRL